MKTLTSYDGHGVPSHLTSNPKNENIKAPHYWHFVRGIHLHLVHWRHVMLMASHLTSNSKTKTSKRHITDTLCGESICIWYIDVTWCLWHLISPATRKRKHQGATLLTLCVGNPFASGGFTLQRASNQYCGNGFHVITSSFAYSNLKLRIHNFNILHAYRHQLYKT